MELFDVIKTLPLLTVTVHARPDVHCRTTGSRVDIVGRTDGFAVSLGSPDAERRLTNLFTCGWRVGHDESLSTAEESLLARSWRLVRYEILCGPTSVVVEQVRSLDSKYVRSYDMPSDPHKIRGAVLPDPWSYLRAMGDRTVLQSPTSPVRLICPHTMRPLDKTWYDDMLTECGNAGGQLVKLLGLLGLIATSHQWADRLPTWEFEDALLHMNSRAGHDHGFGGTFRFGGDAIPPAIMPIPAGRTVTLHRPCRTDIVRRDKLLIDAMETRRSIRIFDSAPCAIADVSEVLFRTCRVVATYGPDEATRYQASYRTYPGGGGSYELEMFLLIINVDGLGAGGYYYDPVGHRLVQVAHTDEPGYADIQSRLITSAQTAMGGGSRPHIIAFMASRMNRLNTKYESMAYATTLKNVGALVSSLYLVTHATGLAGTALGGANPDDVRDLFHLDAAELFPVGEFCFGLAASDTEAIPGHRQQSMVRMDGYRED